jgi:hypothetical protein
MAYLKKNWLLGTGQGIDTNAFVVEISKILNDEFNLIQNFLQLEFLCHYLNFVPEIISEFFITHLYRIKKIDELGANAIYNLL